MIVHSKWVFKVIHRLQIALGIVHWLLSLQSGIDRMKEKERMWEFAATYAWIILSSSMLTQQNK